MEAKYLKINPSDNVAVAITALPAGEKLTVDGKEITLNEDVPAGHKFALKDFEAQTSLHTDTPSAMPGKRRSRETG